MQDDEIMLENTCADLVSLKKNDDFPLRLLSDKRSGEWVCVRDFCLLIGVAPGNLEPAVFACWLSDPMGHESYAVIMFYDGDSGWSLTAHYNRGRLLDGAAPPQALQSSESAGSTSTSMMPPSTAPAEG